MIMKHIIFPLAVLLAIAIVPAYAETYDVVIHENSHTNECLPNCIDPVELKIQLGDTVRWTNAEFCDDPNVDVRCNRIVAIVSGNPEDGQDGQFVQFASMKPGESRTITFDKEGQFDFYDPGHKWLQHTIIVGTVTVEKEVQVTTDVPVQVEVVSENGTKTIVTETKVVTTTEIQVVEVEPTPFAQKSERPVTNDAVLQSLYPDRVSDIMTLINVGLNVNADDVHTVNYIFHEEIGNSQINLKESGNTLGFSFREPTTGSLVLKMPNALIGETLAVIADGDRILEHTYTQQGEFSIVEVQINEPSRVLTFEATYVTPEYLGIAILGAVIATVIGIGVYSTRKQPALLIKA